MKTQLRLLFLLLLFLKGADYTYGQDAKVKKPVFIGLSAYYDFPKSFGVAASADLTLRSKEIFTKAKSGKQKTKYRDLIFTADAGFYHYPFNNSGIYLMPSIGKNYYSDKPYYFGWLATIGVLRTFYDGIVYSVDAGGNVVQRKNFGRYYAVTGIGVILGRNFLKGHCFPFRAEIKPLLWMQYPYNSFMLPHGAAMVGIKYHFKDLNTLVTRKTKGSPKQK